MTPKQRLALFDFDGTLTTKDSFFEFIIFAKGVLYFWIGMIWMFPYLVFFKIGILSAQEIKEKVFIFYFKNYPLDHWKYLCKTFAKDRIPYILRKEAVDQLKIHHEANARIIVVSASIEDWLSPWCESMQIECIATAIEKVEDKITGKIRGSNCNGAEKVKRIQNLLNPENYSPIYAYGDSFGDLEMLTLADYKFYKKFSG